MAMNTRTELLIGKEKLNKLKNANVIVFGVGGVGGFAVEGLVRSGIGNITVVDNDKVDESNINRQIIATYETVGEDKVDAIRRRILAVNPEINVNTVKCFYLPENAEIIDFKKYDYVIDAVDTVSAKLEIIVRAKENNIPVISCMGTGGKIEPTELKVADIKDTKVCPLARVMRRELKKKGIEELKVVFSLEQAVKNGEAEKTNGKIPPPSMIFVPATAGIIIANEVVKDLIK